MRAWCRRERTARHFSAIRPHPNFPIHITFACLLGILLANAAFGEEKQKQKEDQPTHKDFNAYPEDIAAYLARLYDPARRELAFRDDYPGGFDKWQADARAALCLKYGLDKIDAAAGDHEPSVELGETTDHGDYTRQQCTIETEPHVRIPFWLLKPKGGGPWPLGMFPHGHDWRGHHTSAGVFADKKHEAQSLAGDRDVAVQAVKLGFLAIAPAVRGLASGGVPDLHNRHDRRHCRAQLMHCLLAGRTAIGERVWDMQRLLDWATTLPDVDSRHILMMGNSGGGMVTIFTAACDTRITVAVPSCSFAPSISEAGYLFHCDCNMVPGLIDLGGFPAVAGLIAPRHLLAVNGRRDALFSQEAIESAAATVQSLYNAAGCPERFEHRWGAEGHRFYKSLMWPFVLDAIPTKDRGEER